MNKKTSKRQRDIKSKLMAAICMLLVSSIMMVSTTYAWFTLSTAPEVTGITTAVGANGNLEMALLPVDGAVTTEDDYGITSSSGDSMSVSDVTEANVTWGNLVDLGAMNGAENVYGLDKIKLYPAAMNETAEGFVSTEIFLKTPTYGSDGRVAEVIANTTTGVYSGGKFQQSVVEDSTTVDAPTGVRAIGTVSNMTQQQVDFRAAMAAASGLAVRAQDAAETALTQNGSKLAEIAIKHYKGSGTETYEQTDVDALKAMTGALLADDGAIDLLEQAIIQYVWAYNVATNANYDSNRTTILQATDITTLLAYVPVDSVYATMINKLVVNVDGTEDQPDGGTKGKTTAADTGLGNLNSAPYAWETIRPYLDLLANTEHILLNGKTMAEITKGEIMSAVLNGNLTLTLPTGSGVFADIADHAGDYGASITVDAGIYDPEMAGTPIKASMKTATTVANGGYQAQAKAALSEITIEGSDETTAAITDYYGYVIDLAFRTNAAGSYLTLQSQGVDRIYNGENQSSSTDETMGNGSTMTFSGMGSFQDANVVELMKNIRLVFFDPESGEIYAYGYLDENTVDYSNGVTMNMHLSSTNPKNEVTAIDGDQIMELNQNQAHRLSVLVYLDGETVTNKDVAYDADMSMYGSINLQFASTATLKPMVYSNFASIEGASGGENGGSQIPEVTKTITPTVNTTVTGLTVSDVAETAVGYGFTVTGYDAAAHTVTATVNGDTAVDLTYVDGTGFTFTKPESVESVTSVEVTIAANATT